ncbi:hypothetical protein EON66_01025 [archaeon]|nr:MAG: hypothetical protein EON66_01025 [archaeon]
MLLLSWLLRLVVHPNGGVGCAISPVRGHAAARIDARGIESSAEILHSVYGHHHHLDCLPGCTWTEHRVSLTARVSSRTSAARAHAPLASRLLVCHHHHYCWHRCCRVALRCCSAGVATRATPPPMSLPALLRVLLAATCVFAAARAHANFRSLVQIASHAAHEEMDARVVHVHDVAAEPNPAAAAADLQKDERSSSGSVPENAPRVPLPQRNEAGELEGGSVGASCLHSARHPPDSDPRGARSVHSLRCADSSDPADDDISEPYNVGVNIVYPRPGTCVLRQRDVFVHVDVSGNIHDAAHFLCLRVLSSLPTRQRDGVSGEATLSPEELRMREKNAFVQCVVVPGGQLAFRPSPSTPPELTLEVGLLSAVQPATSITDADLRLLELHVHAHGFVHARLVRSVRISVVSPRTCAGQLGQAGCGRLLPHCHSAHTFRFFLEPLLFDGVHERLMHAALNGSTWRTDNADIACVFVVVTQMMTSNQHAAKSVHERHRAIVTLPDWGSSGENHVLLHFGDYGPCRQRAHACSAHVA